MRRSSSLIVVASTTRIRLFARRLAVAIHRFALFCQPAPSIRSLTTHCRIGLANASWHVIENFSRLNRRPASFDKAYPQVKMTDG